MPRISVIVPIHNVEPYLAECLQSIASQTVDDLEVIMVEDGSTDASGSIAARFAAHDARFSLIRQANAGLGAARNRGIAAASGEFLAFVDSDDALPRTAYATLLGALEQTGSDFASGGVRRIDGGRIVPAQFLVETFAQTRLRTHVGEFKPLLVDRTVWNTLWRRSFWGDRRFPVGVWHEDIPVTLPAQVHARSVDVLRDPVYHWRLRDGEHASITQRRLEHKSLGDRLDAVEHVHAVLMEDGPAGTADWYRRRLVRDDLRLHLDLLHQADDAYRATFATRVNALLDGTGDALFSELPAIDRLKWHLVRRGRLDDAVEVLRFAEEEQWPRPVRRLHRWYGDYPFRKSVPRSVCRLGRADLALDVQLDAWHRGDTLELRGRASIPGFGAPARDAQRVRVSALAPGRRQRIEARLGRGAVPTFTERRTDLPAGLAWSGFGVKLEAAQLVPGTELSVSVQTRGIQRRRTRFTVGAAAVRRAQVLAAPDGFVEVAAGDDGAVRIRPRTAHAVLHTYRLDGERLMLAGDVQVPTGAVPELELLRDSDATSVSVPIVLDAYRAGFRAHLPVAELLEAAASLQRLAGGPATCETWRLRLRYADGSVPIEFGSELPPREYATDGLLVRLQAGPAGFAEIVDRQVSRVPADQYGTPRAVQSHDM